MGVTGGRTEAPVGTETASPLNRVVPVQVFGLGQATQNLRYWRDSGRGERVKSKWAKVGEGGEVVYDYGENE